MHFRLRRARGLELAAMARADGRPVLGLRDSAISDARLEQGFGIALGMVYRLAAMVARKAGGRSDATRDRKALAMEDRLSFSGRENSSLAVAVLVLAGLMLSSSFSLSPSIDSSIESSIEVASELLEV